MTIGRQQCHRAGTARFGGTPKMKKRTLLILAGYPGVGKSTLLGVALSKRLPLFGQAFDPAFQSTRPPPRQPEHMLGGEEILAAGAWFTDHNLPFLLDLADLPACVVMHIDLLALIGYRPHLRNLPAELEALMPISAATLAHRERTRVLYRHVLSCDFFGRFDAVVVNTLHAPWEAVAARWNARDLAQGRPATRAGRFMRHYIFGAAEPGRAIHATVHAAWSDSLPTMRPTRSWRSEIVNGQLRMKLAPT